VRRRSQFALRFFLVSIIVLIGAGGLSLTLHSFIPVRFEENPNKYPRSFIGSTLLLIVGSVCLSRATEYVKRERQKLFRRHLVLAMISGMLFVGLQSFALRRFISQQPTEDVQTGAGAFVAVMASLHAMHFVVALLFLVFITVNSFADRYDHEYYWGVTVCSWFWHALGIVWCAIIGVIATSSWTN